MVRARRHASASARAFRKTLSHDEAQWGCTYFKLDANFWGAIHGGHFHDPRATRIEAYRGMKGDSSRRWKTVLSSVATIRSGFARLDSRLAQLERHQAHVGTHRDDRATEPESQLAKRALVVERRTRSCSPAIRRTTSFSFTRRIYASGGMILSGDDLTKISEQKLAMLRKLQHRPASLRDLTTTRFASGGSIF